MKRLMNSEWWKAALMRAIWTMAQTILGVVGTATLLQEVDWLFVLSATGLAGLLSIVKSIAVGVPEVKPEG